MHTWRQLLKKGLNSAEEVAEVFGLDPEEVRKVAGKFRIRISPHYLGLIKARGDALYRQVVPDPDELLDNCGQNDPLAEDKDSPLPGIVHRYPDRVLFLVSHECASYCRFCTRKRMVGDAVKMNPRFIEQGLDYIRLHPEIRDVIVSGGDPLLLSDNRLDGILTKLRAIPHVEIIRIGTRVPCFLPQRITRRLVGLLKRHHPLFMNVHFNHPDELTPETVKALGRLADAGIPLGNQTVLLKGVNDDPEIMKRLLQKLLACRVRPYYIYQADMIEGTAHLRTRVEKGLEIVRSLRGWTSGLAVPHFVIDSPGGGGKIPLLPEYVESVNDQEVVLRNYEGRRFVYRQVNEKAAAPAADLSGALVPSFAGSRDAQAEARAAERPGHQAEAPAGGRAASAPPVNAPCLADWALAEQERPQ
ncbi:MAG: KamA family radical SAM protein [Lentisphaerae bacterium]|nr:KamA family radical SAM protein [Lentisphaerota bacterium]